MLFRSGWYKRDISADVSQTRVDEYEEFVLQAAGLRWYFDPEVLEPLTMRDERDDLTIFGRVLDAIGRGFGAGSQVEVSQDRVFSLLRQAQTDGVVAALPESKPTEPAAPETWWTADSTNIVSAPIGRLGGSGALCLSFDSQLSSSALIAGRPGSGKTSLLHAFVTSLAMLYSPSELELYLLDFKEGVEFMTYVTERLPHARVVAVEAEREFGVAVLNSLQSELERRGELFRATGGDQAGLVTYRQMTSERLPRIVLIIDEFQKLFEVEDKLSDAAARVLDNLVRQGRGFGIHAVLASQTLQNLGALGRHTVNLIPIRIALQCGEAESRVILGEDNGDAQLLSRPGEAIFNPKGGAQASNSRFQGTLIGEQERQGYLRAIRKKAEDEGVVTTTRDRKSVV